MLGLGPLQVAHLLEPQSHEGHEPPLNLNAEGIVLITGIPIIQESSVQGDLDFTFFYLSL